MPENEIFAIFVMQTIPMLILANFAKWSIAAVALLLAADLLIGLPFTALWGFVLVPIGAAFSIAAGYYINK